MICPFCRSDNDETADICFRCGKGLFALTQGQLLGGRYEIIRPLGKGGMGLVYKAHDRALDEIVAVKILRGDVAQEAEMARRFRSEIKLARKVRHRNVCAIHEYGEEGHLRFIVMEYIEGVDFKRILREKGALPPEEAIEVAVQVASALQAIHDVGIVHRDLKTPNIMRDATGLVRLMDFGIAKRFESDGTTGATATGHIVGTPEYMSPEQARGQKLDPRSDLYALGVVIFELFTGDVPFRGESPVATILKQLQEAAPLDGPKALRLPPPLRPVLEKALSKDPEDRFASAHEMAGVLKEAWSRAFPASAPTPVPIRTVTAPRLDLLEPETTPIPTPVPTPAPTPVPTGVPTAVKEAAHDLSQKARQGDRPPLVERIQARPAPAGRATKPPAMSPWAWALPTGVAAAFGALWLVRGVLLTPSQEGPPVGSEAPASPLAAPVASEEARAGAAFPSPAPSPEGAVGSAPPSPVSDLGRQAPLASPSARAGLVAALPRGVAPAVATPGPPARAPIQATPPPTTLPTLALRPEPARQSPVTAAAPSSPAPALSAAESPEPAPSPSKEAEEMGMLQFVVEPWAQVSVDGSVLGLTPLQRIRLSPGPHAVVLTHPDYQPFQRKVTIRPGETFKLAVDLRSDGVRKKR